MCPPKAAQMKVILIVEDDDFMRDALVETLEDEDYEAHGAASGPEALKLAAELTFDLVVTDVRMPGMDGLECLSRMRETIPELRAIVITGYAESDAPTRAVQLAASDYLYKPFNIGQLVEAVEKVLNQEQEREKGLGLLGSLRAGYQKLVARLGGGAKDRDRAYQAFFVGVRSKRLVPEHALAHWKTLSDLEEQLAQGASASELKASYQEIVEKIAVQSQSDPIGELTAEDRAAAERICARVREGELSPELLQLAPYLESHKVEAEEGALAAVLGG